ncbi:hypothetical protein Taro_018003 [Colocasia esculenta]|uniref:Thymidylate kinase n=1 Tax=Colocasia esculenta TaxID=4460 RepID=A0A843UV02_COLES|nr:hypothetical protein [Colocasia esculenta]
MKIERKKRLEDGCEKPSSFPLALAPSPSPSHRPPRRVALQCLPSPLCHRVFGDDRLGGRALHFLFSQHLNTPQHLLSLSTGRSPFPPSHSVLPAFSLHHPLRHRGLHALVQADSDDDDLGGGAGLLFAPTLQSVEPPSPFVPAPLASAAAHRLHRRVARQCTAAPSPFTSVASATVAAIHRVSLNSRARHLCRWPSPCCLPAHPIASATRPRRHAATPHRSPSTSASALLQLPCSVKERGIAVFSAVSFKTLPEKYGSQPAQDGRRREPALKAPVPEEPVGGGRSWSLPWKKPQIRSLTTVAPVVRSNLGVHLRRTEGRGRHLMICRIPTLQMNLGIVRKPGCLSSSWNPTRRIGTIQVKMENCHWDNSRGSLIVLEGLDRSGKTSQSNSLVSFLKGKGVPVEAWHFPDRSTTVGGMISSYLANKSQLDDRTIHLLFSANRWEKSSLMETKLKSGVTLVVDRYSYSGVAFSAAKGLDIQWCKAPEEGLIAPDLVLYLDIPPEKAAERGGYGSERYEHLDFQQKVASHYTNLHDHTWKVIDACQPAEDIEKQLRELALECISSRRDGKPLSRLWLK